MQSKTQYSAIRNSAWQFSIKNGVDSLPLDVESIAEKNDWNLLEVESNMNIVRAVDKKNLHKTCEAFTCIYKEQFFIFYKKPRYSSRWLFSIAHEFGHIELYHFDDLTGEEYEQEANMFAARILMPICVLKECGATSPARIRRLCGTSMTASRHRATRLQMLMNRNEFYLSPLERQVVKQFQSFILQNKK